MKNLITDTQDPIEKKWGLIVMHNFPNYGKFWNKFVGVRNLGTIIRPYKLKYDSGMSFNEKNLIRLNFDKINRHHYTLFCNLAGAHHQLELINKSVLIPDPDTRHFEHWDSFENFYFKLGNCVYQVTALWGIILKMNGRMTSLPGSMRNGFSRPLYSMMEVLTIHRKKNKWLDFIRIKNIIKEVRDDIIHHARKAGSHVEGIGFLVPFRKNVSRKARPPRRNISWLRQVKNRRFFKTTQKAKNDLDFLEKTINELYQCLISELDVYLTNNNIEVMYE